MKFGTLQFTGAAFMLSGVLHFLTLIFSGAGLPIAVIGALWILLGYFLYRGKSWLSWPVFLLSAFGVAAALVNVFGAGGWVWWLIVFADILTAASAFWMIWKRP